MARDEFLLKEKKGIFLCVYGWDPPALSYGYGQKSKEELDLERLNRDGITYIRRPTGGRTLLHDKEITYSVVAKKGGMFGLDLNATYRRIGLALKSVLEYLGIDCVLEKGRTRDKRSRQGASPPCFTSTARYEIKVGGKKLLGSAQKRTKDRFLQHGALIIDYQKDITEYLRLEEKRKKAYQDLMEKEATSLKEITGRQYNFEELAEAFSRGFAKAWAMEAIEYALTVEDIQRIKQIEEKYCSPEWNKVY